MPILILPCRRILKRIPNHWHLVAIASLVALWGLVSVSFGQTTDSTSLGLRRDSLPAVDGYFLAPALLSRGSSKIITSDAYRFYSSPITLTALFEVAHAAMPLLLSDESYGRESFLLSSRQSEPMLGAAINGALPLADPISGVQMLNYYPLDAFGRIALESGIRAFDLTSAASSDHVNLELEQFRSVLPYSRIHFTQVLARRLSYFDGIFGLNASRNLNVSFGVNRVSSGNPIGSDLNFNTRVDRWAARNLITWAGLAGDSLGRPNILLWTNYMTGFSGTSGGIDASDSIDVFDAQLAPVRFAHSFDHRTRLDLLLQFRYPLLAEAESQLSGYYSRSDRRLFPNDSGFPAYAMLHANGERAGLALRQPLVVRIGDFITAAEVSGEISLSRKSPNLSTISGEVVENRISMLASDSLSLRTAIGISLFGLAKGVQSTLTYEGKTESKFFPALALGGEIFLSKYLAFLATYNYARDRAAQSPSPMTEYTIRNAGFFLQLQTALGSHDSLALRASVLDRNEPEGLLLDRGRDSLLLPRFSGLPEHTQSAEVGADLYVGHVHFGGALTYFPAFTLAQSKAIDAPTPAEIPQRFYGLAELKYEDELFEGNLRLSAGARLRYWDRLGRLPSYDAALDGFVYPSAAVRPDLFASGDARLENPRYILDLIASTEVDRKAQINISVLNLLGTPYYSSSLYPRAGTALRIDVTWAFLD